MNNKAGIETALFFCVLLISGVIFFPIFLLHASSADWRVYAGTDEGQFYYDAESITHPSPDTVHFRHKVIFSEKGIKRAVESFGKEYEKLAYSISVREINCSEKKVRSLGVTYFTEEGITLDMAVDTKAEWHIIEPTAVIEGLYQRVCRQ
jgi:hypothetical protein